MFSIFLLTTGILIFLLTLIFYSKFHKLFFLSSLILIFSSLFFLDIYSYDSDLFRYSNPVFINSNLSTLPDYLFFKISSFIFDFFNSRKLVVFFWQLIILLNFIYAENLIINLSRKIKVNYNKGLFIFLVFITVGVQTIYNQLRYGVGFSLLLITSIYIFRYLNFKKKKDIFIALLFTFLSLGIHTNASLIFLLILLSTYILKKLSNFVRLNLFGIRILNIPLSLILIIFSINLLLIIFLGEIQAGISSIPFINKIYVIWATKFYQGRPQINYLISVVYAILNVMISYRAIINNNLQKFIPTFKIINLLSIASIPFLLFPLASRITSLCVFLPLPFFVSYSKLSGSYFFRGYYLLLTISTILRFDYFFLES